MSIIIHVEDISLRSWDPTDASQLTAVGNNSSIAFNMNDGFPNPYTEDKAVAFIKNASNSPHLLLAIEKSGRIIGSIGAFDDNKETRKATIAYFIGKDYWNQGYGTKAIKGIVEYLVKKKGIRTIIAEPFERNTGSRKILERNGFILKGISENGSKKDKTPISICQYEYAK